MKIYVMKKDGHWYVDFTGGNGEIVAVTETYTTKAAAHHAANLIKAQAGDAPIFDVDLDA